MTSEAAIVGIREIVEAEREVATRRTAMLEAKEEAKAAKESFDSSVEDLLAVIRRVRNGEQSLPFGQDRPAEAAPTPPDTAPPAEDDSWRDVPLDILVTPHGSPLAPGILKALAEAEPDVSITTVGQLADFTATGKDLTAIRGIGEAKAEEIRKALDLFWAARQAPAATVDPPADGEGYGLSDAGPFVSDLELDAAIVIHLGAAGIRTIAELNAMTPESLVAIPGISEDDALDITGALEAWDDNQDGLEAA